MSFICIETTGNSRQPHDTQIADEGSWRIISLRTFPGAATSVVAVTVTGQPLATVLSPRVGRSVAFRFLSVKLTVLSYGNLRGKSLQGPQSATIG